MLKYSWLRAVEDARSCCLFVHGRAGNLSVMSAFSSLIPKHMPVVSVQAPYKDLSTGSDNSFSWWLDMFRDNPSAEQQMQIKKSSRSLLEFIDSLSIKPILAVGFSQGAAMLSLLVQQRPDLFTHCALLAGFVLKHEKAVAHATNNSSKIFMTHGTNDQIVDIEWARQGHKTLSSAGFDIKFLETDASHKVSAQAMTELKKFFELACLEIRL